MPVRSCLFSVDLAAPGADIFDHHLNGHDRVLVLLEDGAALLGEFIGATGGARAGQREGQGEKETMGLVTHRSSWVRD